MTDERLIQKDAVRRAVGGVLFNVSNFPERARAMLWGSNMGPLIEKITGAVVAALDEAHTPTDEDITAECDRRYPELTGTFADHLNGVRIDREQAFEHDGRRDGFLEGAKWAAALRRSKQPTDDDREAQANRYIAGRGDSQTRRDFLAGWDAALRRSEVPEPSTEDEFALQVTVRAEPIGGGKESLDVDVDIVEPSTPAWAAGLLRQIADDLAPEPQGEPSDAQDIVVQEVSRLAGMKMLRRYSQFSDDWWNQLHAGIARVALTAAAVTEQGENR